MAVVFIMSAIFVVGCMSQNIWAVETESNPISEESVTMGTLGENNGIQWSYDENTKTLTVTGQDSGLNAIYNNEKRIYESPFTIVAKDLEEYQYKMKTAINVLDVLDADGNSIMRKDIYKL